MASAPSAFPAFAAAAQPDIVRAAQKDAFYLKDLVLDPLADIAKHVLGPRMLARVQREVDVSGRLLYYALTTLSGLQTLGEEYCDIVQVKRGRLLQVPDRVRLLVWQLLVPFVYQRAKLRLARYAATPATRADGVVARVVKAWLSAHLARMDTVLSVLYKVHLASFYFDGVFFDVAKRLTNTRYVFIRKHEHRPRYSLLGVLIVLQLAVHALMRLHALMRSRATPTPADPAGTTDGGTAAAGGGVASSGVGGDGSAADVYSSACSGACTLCLEPRMTAATATECGHTFCWQCIAEACSNKAECPLCRQPISLQGLVRIFQ